MTYEKRWDEKRWAGIRWEDLRWDEVWSVKSAVWSVGREECSVKCGVWRKQWEVRSVDCEVWSVECEVKCGVRRVQCEVWSVECEVCSVKSAVRSVKCEVELHMWHVKQDTTFAECTHTRAWLAHGACKVYRWERSYISPRQLPPRLLRVLLVIYNWILWVHCFQTKPSGLRTNLNNVIFGIWNIPFLGHFFLGKNRRLLKVDTYWHEPLLSGTT